MVSGTRWLVLGLLIGICGCASETKTASTESKSPAPGTGKPVVVTTVDRNFLNVLLRFGPVADELRKELKGPVNVLSDWDDRSIIVHFENKKDYADLLYLDPVEFCRVSEKTKLVPIAFRTNAAGSTSETGLIVVAKNSPIKDVGELKDKQFAFGMHQSPYQFYSVLEYFKSRGFPVATLKGVSYHKDNLSVAQTVLMKFANAGVVTQTWWETAKDRTLDLSKLLKDELRVIGKTEPLPEYVWAVTESVPAERKAAVSKALTENLAKNQAALAGFAAQGFTPAGDKDMDAACARLLAIKNVPPAPLLPSPLVPLNPLP